MIIWATFYWPLSSFSLSHWCLIRTCPIFAFGFLHLWVLRGGLQCKLYGGRCLGVNHLELVTNWLGTGLVPRFTQEEWLQHQILHESVSCHSADFGHYTPLYHTISGSVPVFCSNSAFTTNSWRTNEDSSFQGFCGLFWCHRCTIAADAWQLLTAEILSNAETQATKHTLLECWLCLKDLPHGNSLLNYCIHLGELLHLEGGRLFIFKCQFAAHSTKRRCARPEESCSSLVNIQVFITNSAHSKGKNWGVLFNRPTWIRWAFRHLVQRWYYVYLVIYVLFLTAVGKSLTNTLDYLLKNPKVGLGLAVWVVSSSHAAVWFRLRQSRRLFWPEALRIAPFSIWLSLFCASADLWASWL